MGGSHHTRSCCRFLSDSHWEECAMSGKKLITLCVRRFSMARLGIRVFDSLVYSFGFRFQSIESTLRAHTSVLLSTTTCRMYSY